MTLALLILAKATAVAAPPPDFEWSEVIRVSPPPMAPMGTGPRPPITVTATNVELTGAGEPVLDIAPKVFDDLLAATASDRQVVPLRMWFDASGKLLTCEGRYGWRADHVTPICAAAASARFAFAPGFAQPMERGYINLWVDFQRRFEPVLPLRLRPRDKGTQVRLAVSAGNACRITSGKIADPAASQICKAVIANPRSIRARLAAGGASVGWFNVRVWLDTKDLPPERRVDVMWETRADRIGETIFYPERTAAEPAMSLAAGRFSLTLAPQDWPKAASGVTVAGPARILIGISPDGKVQSCRPIGSSGSAMIDNSACALSVSRGRFEPAPGFSFTDLRYVTHTVERLFSVKSPTAP
ncbi:MAG: TonB family protein [Novosphingobium sp.]